MTINKKAAAKFALECLENVIIPRMYHYDYSYDSIEKITDDQVASFVHFITECLEVAKEFYLAAFGDKDYPYFIDSIDEFEYVEQHCTNKNILACDAIDLYYLFLQHNIDLSNLPKDDFAVSDKDFLDIYLKRA